MDAVNVQVVGGCGGISPKQTKVPQSTNAPGAVFAIWRVDKSVDTW